MTLNKENTTLQDQLQAQAKDKDDQIEISRANEYPEGPGRGSSEKEGPGS